MITKKPYTKKMKEWQQEYDLKSNDLYKQTTKLQGEVTSLEDGISKAVVGFGIAIDVANNKLDKIRENLSRISKQNNEMSTNRNSEFKREFKLDYYNEVDWNTPAKSLT